MKYEHSKAWQFYPLLNFPAGSPVFAWFLRVPSPYHNLLESQDPRVTPQVCTSQTPSALQEIQLLRHYLLQQEMEGSVETGAAFGGTPHSDVAHPAASPRLLNLDSTTAFQLHKILLQAQGTALSTHTCVAILPLTHSSH